MSLEEKLIKACEAGCLTLVKKLVEAGADIHADNDWALRSAAENGQLDVVKCLVSNDANIRVWNDYAIMLLNNKLIEACKAGSLKLVMKLVEAGADIHADDDSALYWATDNGHTDVVKYLESLP